MPNITFLRTTLDILFNNSMVRAIANFVAFRRNYKAQNYDFVNFCNNNEYLEPNTLKFLKNVPFNNIIKGESETKSYTNRFLFTNANIITGTNKKC